MTELFDRVKETCTCTGTGIISLIDAIDDSFETYRNTYLNTGLEVPYCIVDPGIDYEVGVGTFTASNPNTITRDAGKVTASSNSNNIVSFAAGDKICFANISKAFFDTVSRLDKAETRSASLNMADNELIRPLIVDSAHKVSDHPGVTGAVTVTLDYAAANEHMITVTGVGLKTIRVSNWPASGVDAYLGIEIKNGGGNTTWSWQVEVGNAAPVWLSGEAQPTLAALGRDFIGLFTKDGGTTVHAGHVGTA